MRSINSSGEQIESIIRYFRPQTYNNKNFQSLNLCYWRLKILIYVNSRSKHQIAVNRPMDPSIYTGRTFHGNIRVPDELNPRFIKFQGQGTNFQFFEKSTCKEGIFTKYTKISQIRNHHDIFGVENYYKIFQNTIFQNSISKQINFNCG